MTIEKPIGWAPIPLAPFPPMLGAEEAFAAAGEGEAAAAEGDSAEGAVRSEDAVGADGFAGGVITVTDEVTRGAEPEEAVDSGQRTRQNA